VFVFNHLLVVFQQAAQINRLVAPFVMPKSLEAMLFGYMEGL